MENIKGIGKETANQLLKTFKSVKNIKEKTKEEIAIITGNAKAELIKQYFENNK